MIEARFEIGQTAKYTGASSSKIEKDGELKPFMFPGMLVEIMEIYPSAKPLGQVTEEIYDDGHNGYNIGRNEHGIEIVVWPEDDWELNEPEVTKPNAWQDGKSNYKMLRPDPEAEPRNCLGVPDCIIVDLPGGLDVTDHKISFHDPKCPMRKHPEANNAPKA